VAFWADWAASLTAWAAVSEAPDEPDEPPELAVALGLLEALPDAELFDDEDEHPATAMAPAVIAMAPS
jgi:hypothetical protein